MKNLKNKMDEELAVIYIDQEKGKKFIDSLSWQEEMEEEEHFMEGNVFQKKKKIYRRPLLAAASIALFLSVVTVGVTTGAFASGGRILQSLIFVKQAEEEEKKIETGIYSDEDAHIRMEITELFSDGDRVEMGVSYTALDEKGKNWIGQKGDDSIYTNEVLFSADIADDEKTGIYEEGIFYYEKAEDNSSLRFSYSYAESVREGIIFRLSGQKIRVYYALSGSEKRETDIQIRDNTKKAVYRLQLAADEKPDYLEYYIPRYLVLSEYGYVILGENVNTIAYKDGKYNRSTYRLRGESYDEIEKTDKVVEYTKAYLKYVNRDEEQPYGIWFFDKDGEKTYALGSVGPGAYLSDATEYEDIYISGDSFLDQNEKETFHYGLEAIYKNVPINVSHLEKMEYLGVPYRLVKEDDPKVVKMFLGEE